MPAPTHIAVLDDEQDITDLLASYLRTHGFRVTALQQGAALFELFACDPPALVLLDLGLPGEDGLAMARRLREHCGCGLVIVSGRGDAVDKVVGLEIGADDYVTKPFDLRELLARVRAVLRRLVPAAAAETGPPAALGPPAAPTSPVAAGMGMGQPVPARFGFAAWTLDTGARQLLGPAGEVGLTTGEYDLLHAFVTYPGRVLSRDFLLEHTRGRGAGPFDRTIDVQVGRLRKKLEADPNEPQLLKSVRGAGYILVAQVHMA